MHFRYYLTPLILVILLARPVQARMQNEPTRTISLNASNQDSPDPTSVRNGREQKRIERKLIKKINGIYREIVAAYKAQSFDYAHERLVILEELLDPNLLPSPYYKKMTNKLIVTKKWMQRYYQKIITRNRRDQEDKLFQQLHMSAQKKVLQASAATQDDARNFKFNDRPNLEDHPKASQATKAISKVTVKEKEVAPQDVKMRTSSGKRDLLVSYAQDEHVETNIKPKLQTEKDLKLSINKVEQPLKKEYIYKIHALYEDGLLLYRKGLYEPSLKIFVEVERLWPDYKLTRKYLALLERHLPVNNEVETIQAKRREVLIQRKLAVYQTLDYFEKHANADQDK